MKIIYENVQTIAQLPFKYFEHDSTKEIIVAPHWHQGIEINYLIAGNDLNFVINGKTTTYHPGDIWTINHRDIHSARSLKPAHYLKFGLIIDDDFLQHQVPASKNWHLNMSCKNTRQQDSLTKVQGQLSNIRQLLKQPLTDLSRLEIMSCFYGLLHELGANFNQPQISPTTNPNLPLLNTVMSNINQNYAENIDGNTLAEQFHVSLTTLNKQFNFNIQMSVNRYLRMIRLMNSRKLLLETDRTIDYIAASCGFSSNKTFNRNFKAWKGLTPSEYRACFAQDHKIDTNCL